MNCDASDRDKVNLVGCVVELSGLLAYQKGAVVSRTVIDKETGTVTVFAFDKAQGLSEHTAPFDALVYVLEGEVEIMIAGETQRVSGGQMLIMPAHKPHALAAVERFKMLLVMIQS